MKTNLEKIVEKMHRSKNEINREILKTSLRIKNLNILERISKAAKENKNFVEIELGFSSDCLVDNEECEYERNRLADIFEDLKSKRWVKHHCIVFIPTKLSYGAVIQMVALHIKFEPKIFLSKYRKNLSIDITDLETWEQIQKTDFEYCYEKYKLKFKNKLTKIEPRSARLAYFFLKEPDTLFGYKKILTIALNDNAKIENKDNPKQAAASYIWELNKEMVPYFKNRQFVNSQKNSTWMHSS